MARSSLLLVSSLLTTAIATSPGFQVDLVFPQNNTVYQPVYPFPIVWVLHNFSSAWQFKPVLEWRLDHLNTPSSTLDTSYLEWETIGWDDKTPDQPPPTDHFLAIKHSASLSRFNSTGFALEYTLGFVDHENCTEYKIQLARGGRIFFNSDITTGKMPDFALSSCTTPLAATGVITQNQTNAKCPLVETPRPKPVPCAFKIDANITQQISRKMTEVADCGKLTWPNGTGIETQCVPSAQQSAVNVVQLGSLGMIFISLTVGLWVWD